jgi:hypothetical protein
VVGGGEVKRERLMDLAYSPALDKSCLLDMFSIEVVVTTKVTEGGVRI